MSLIRYNNPWNLLNNIHQENYNPAYSHANNDDSTTSWTPAIDISEDEEAFTLFADIPGVNPDNITISTEKNVLTIKGERLASDAKNKENLRRIERQNGQFSRHFTLPDSADTDKIKAKSKHGVLTITIPKQEVAVSRKIEIKH